MASSTRTIQNFIDRIVGGDCWVKCHSRSSEHANYLQTAITKANDDQLKIVTLVMCRNVLRQSFGTTSSGHQNTFKGGVRKWSSYGRSLAHWAAACGRFDYLKWLVEKCAVDLNLKDLESGYSLLHTAVLYGQLECAQFLFDSGANLFKRDNEGLTVIDLIEVEKLVGLHKLDANSDDNDFQIKLVRNSIYSLKDGPSEVYSYGENISYNLGHTRHAARTNPELIDFFRRNGISLQQISMAKLHTLFLDTNGKAYSCGHGLGGRLGTGTTTAQLVPILVGSIPEKITLVSAGLNHSIFCTDSGKIYSCGSNQYGQIGQGQNWAPSNPGDPHQIVMPKTWSDKFIGCSAGLLHSVFWTELSIFVCGLNAGQLGITALTGKFIWSLKQIPFRSDDGIHSIKSSAGAVAVVTNKRHVFLLTSHTTKRIVYKLSTLDSVEICGGRLGDVESKDLHSLDDVKVVILTTDGKIYIWCDTDPVVRRCIFGGSYLGFTPSSIALSQTGDLFICTSRGAIHRTSIRKATIPTNLSKTGTKLKQRQTSPECKETPLVSPSSRSSVKVASGHHGGHLATEFGAEFLDISECVSLSLSHGVSGVQRAIAATCSPDGRNICILQQHPSVDLTDIPMVEPSEMTINFNQFLSETDDTDLLHDIVLVVGEHQFAAHKFILVSRCPYFAKHLTCESVEFQVENPPPREIFEQFLKFVYTDTCDYLQDGKKIAISSDSFARIENIEHFEAVGRKKKKSGHKKNAKIMSSPEAAGFNPILKLQDIAKRFNVKNLVRSLEFIRFDHETKRIAFIPDAEKHWPKLRFDISYNDNNNVEELDLRDVQIVCEDGVEINAHKCILAARLDYFRCMFNSSWIESAQNQTLTMPMSSKILKDLIYYLYVDDLPLAKCDDTDRICLLLVHSDQLLIERLRQKCEVALSTMITMRNVIDLLIFASTYNADQLRNSCFQFCCLNFGSLFEMNALGGLESMEIRDLASYYRQMFQHVEYRHVSPSSDKPSIDEIQLIYSQFESLGVEIDELFDVVQSNGTKPLQSDLNDQSITIMRTAAVRKNSETTPESPPSSNRDPVVAKLANRIHTTTEIETPLPSNHTNVDINSVLESANVVEQSPVNIFDNQRRDRCISGNNKVTASWQFRVSSESDQDSSFVSLKEVMNEQELYFGSLKKSKKKLANTSFKTSSPPPKPTPSRDPINPWKVSADSSSSLSDKFENSLLINDIKKDRNLRASPFPVEPFLSASPKKSFSEQLSEDLTSDRQKRTKTEFSNIIFEEESLQIARKKLDKKSLDLIQIEERAISELYFNYGLDINNIECITVQRVSKATAAPTWKAHV